MDIKDSRSHSVSWEKFEQIFPESTVTGIMEFSWRQIINHASWKFAKNCYETSTYYPSHPGENSVLV